MSPRLWRLAVAGGLTLATGCTAAAEGPPPGSVQGPVEVTRYDGASDDLLTAGLGAVGIASPIAPSVSTPPTPAELRRLAIYNNYRALVDTSVAGGYGRFYGPGVRGPEKVAGVEYLAFAAGREGRQNVTLLVQIPAGFDPARACIVTGPSSGSRGIYGAIGTAGEVGLGRGCAVAYTDKGTGTGAHELTLNEVGAIDGVRGPADVIGRRSTFTADLTPGERRAFSAATPHRFAWKHAHSEVNPERDWGRNVIQSIEFALYALNREYAGRREPFTADNTLVVASSVSNGGGASLRAAEEAPRGLIDGVAVSEPNVNPRFDDRFVIRQGAGPALSRHSRPLFDYITLLNLYQGCANLDLALVGAPLNATLAPLGAGRCRSLRQAGLLRADDLVGQAREAQARINAYGILPEQNVLQPSHWFINVPQAIALTYANAYSRASVLDNLCGYSFAAVDAALRPAEQPAGTRAILFGTSSGIPPTGGVEIINNQAIGGPSRDRESISRPFGRLDQNLAGAACLRSLATGYDELADRRLQGREARLAERAAAGVRQVLATGELRGIPTVIVTGRQDAVLPPNHASRPYYALSRLRDREQSRIHYHEVLNAQHLDTLNGLPGFAERFVPLHVYYLRAVDLVFDHLTNNAPLPPSQVVRATPRGPGAPPLADPNVPEIAARPPAGDRIAFDGRVLVIPE